MKRDSIAWSYVNTIKLRKKSFDSRERCLCEWRGNINKILKTGKFKDLTFEEDWEVNLSIEIRKC